MRILLTQFAFIASFWQLVECAKILLTIMPQGRSHALTYMPFMHRLVEDGHEVTIYFEIERPEISFGGGVREELLLLQGINVLNFPIIGLLLRTSSIVLHHERSSIQYQNPAHRTHLFRNTCKKFFQLPLLLAVSYV